MRALVPVISRSVAVIGAATAIGAAAPVAAAPAAAAVRQPARSQSAAVTSLNDNLTAVAAISAASAWAVGTYQASGWAQTLIEHWNGTAWNVTASPDPGGQAANNFLYAVAAASTSSAWAVGGYRKGGAWHALIEHWDGIAWKQVPSPGPAGPGSSTHLPSTALYGVAAVSAANVWAVGKYRRGAATKALIVHWNGTAWTQVASPRVGSSRYDVLHGIAALSSVSIWAAGVSGGPSGRTLIERWNGAAWKQVAGPNPVGPTFFAAAATSPASAWAVGTYDHFNRPLAEHWNGMAWKQVAVPVSAGLLSAAAATSAGSAWAVGWTAAAHPLIEHWNGRSWITAASPSPGSFGDGFLYGATALSARDVWAVGNYLGGGGSLTLIEHWNGTRWRQVPSPNQ